MIHEFAVSPKLFSEATEIKFLCQSFGCGEGRLISDIPKKLWEREVLNVIKRSENKPIMQQSMKRNTQKLIKKALYKRNTQPKTHGNDWIDYVVSAHKERPFRALLIDINESIPGGGCPFINNGLELVDNDLWNVPKDIIIERQSKIMVKAIKPMIDCSNEIMLVDRFFRPDQARFRNVLYELIKVVENRSFSPAIKKITYHVGNQFPEPSEENWRTSIWGLLPKDFKLEIVVWPKKKMHDRFVLSNVGGISFGQGLDEFLGDGPKDVRINILAEQPYKYWYRECKSKSPTFTIQK